MSALTIAIPSKGRLKANSESFFAAAGYKLEQQGGDRGYSACLLYTSPSPRDQRGSRMPSSA